MRSISLLVAFSAGITLAQAQFISKGTHEGVEIAYRWRHPKGKPSELQLRMKNAAATDKRISLGIDLYYQGLTVESFEADTCLHAGQQITGRLNGFYFIPQRLTTAQIKDGGADIDITRTVVTDEPCP